MSTYNANGYMDNSAPKTVSMLKKFDHLIDILNASKTKSTSLNKQPYTESGEQGFLKKVLCN